MVTYGEDDADGDDISLLLFDGEYNSFRLPTMIDDEALSSAASPMIEIDNPNLNIFPVNAETLDNASLYSLHTAPLRMVTYDDDDDDALSLLLLDGKWKSYDESDRPS